MAMHMDVSDVYEAATKIGQEFQRLIEQYGTEALSDLLAMVVSSLEKLEHTVDQLGEAYKENDRLCVELSQLEAEKGARHKLSKEKKTLKEMLMQKDKEVDDFKAAVQSNERKQAELITKLQALEEVAVSADASKKQVEELQVKLSTVEQQLKETEEQVEDKSQEIKTLSEQLKDRAQAAQTTTEHDEPTADLKQKLTDLEKALAVKDNELGEKARKVKQLGRQLEEQKATLSKMEQTSADYKDAQERLSKLQKQLEAKDKHISERNRQMKQAGRQMEEKVGLLEKAGTERQKLQEKVTHLERAMQEKEKQLDVKVRKIKQLNKQLAEQQDAVSRDQHENGTDTSTSDSQQDSVSALKEKIAELEDELETARIENKKTLEKLKSNEEGKQPSEGVPVAVQTPLKTSVSDSALTRSAWKTKPDAPGTLGVQPEEEEPEFYRSDLLKILEEKTRYMTLHLEAEDEIALLKEQLASMQELHLGQRKPSLSKAAQKESGVRDIMEKTVTLRRGYSLNTSKNSTSVACKGTDQ